jgi:hypothetical protein|tara:strand:+ start:2893 stop:3144 length:252 start_codon:yes stop_codon:yes gene_type:complete
MPRRSQTVIDVVCSSCDTKMLDMQHVESADRANRLGAVSVPAIIIIKKLADCFTGRDRLPIAWKQPVSASRSPEPRCPQRRHS